MFKTISGFTPAGRARFVEFLRDAYGPEYYESRVSLEACEAECIEACEQRLNAGETMSWEISQYETPLRRTTEFRADEDDFVVEDQEIIE